MTWWGKGGDRFALDFHVFCLCRCVCAIALLLAKGRNCKIGCVCVCVCVNCPPGWPASARI